MSDRVQLEVELPRAEVASHVARHALRALCAEQVETDLLIDAELLVSELATNALVHGRGNIKLRAAIEADRLWAEVVDEGAGFAHALHARDRDQGGGWGLDIVDDVASRWSMHEARVWFEIERQGPRFERA